MKPILNILYIHLRMAKKLFYPLLIAIIFSGCDYLGSNKQKKWESISIKEKRALYQDVNKNKSSYQLQDFINEFGTPIDSLDYKLKFTKDTIEYQGLLSPNMKSRKEYEKYVKQIEPINNRLLKKYKYEAETNVFKLREEYYKKMEQYQYKYKESRQDRLSRIKLMIPNWDEIYIDDYKYRDLYSNTSEGSLNLDLKYQNCIRYDFALAEKITHQSVYGTYKGNRDANKSINTFGYVLVDENNNIKYIDGYYRFDENENSATEKNNQRTAILFGLGLLGFIFFLRIRAKIRFKKMQAKELLYLEEILNDARSMNIDNAKSKYYKLKKYLLKNTNSESKFTEIETRIKYTLNCSICKKPNFIQSSLKLVDSNTSRYMTNGRKNKDGSLDKRFNTEYSYSTTYYYSAYCESCKKDYKFNTFNKI